MNKAIAIVVFITGFLSLLTAGYYLYAYRFAGKFWLYMIPAYKLIILLCLGLISMLAGFLFFKHQNKKSKVFSVTMLVSVLLFYLFL